MQVSSSFVVLWKEEVMEGWCRRAAGCLYIRRGGYRGACMYVFVECYRAPQARPVLGALPPGTLEIFFPWQWGQPSFQSELRSARSFP